MLSWLPCHRLAGTLRPRLRQALVAKGARRAKANQRAKVKAVRLPFNLILGVTVSLAALAKALIVRTLIGVAVSLAALVKALAVYTRTLINRR